MLVAGVILYVTEKVNNKNFKDDLYNKHNLLLYFVIAFLVFFLLFKTFHVLVQVRVLSINPIKRYEATNLFLYKECFDAIPKKKSVIYSNSFEYPSGTLEGRDAGMHLTVFGHQAYAANSFYERYPIAIKRIAEQKKTLSNSAATISEICSLHTDKNGYSVIDKKYSYPLSMRAHFLIENKVCAVFYASSSICK